MKVGVDNVPFPAQKTDIFNEIRWTRCPKDTNLLLTFDPNEICMNDEFPDDEAATPYVCQVLMTVRISFRDFHQHQSYYFCLKSRGIEKSRQSLLSRVFFFVASSHQNSIGNEHSCLHDGSLRVSFFVLRSKKVVDATLPHLQNGSVSLNLYKY